MNSRIQVNDQSFTYTVATNRDGQRTNDADERNSQQVEPEWRVNSQRHSILIIVQAVGNPEEKTKGNCL